MKKLIISNIAGPLARRAGTALASFIAGLMAVDPQMAERVELAVGAVILVALDLVSDHLASKTREAD